MKAMEIIDCSRNLLVKLEGNGFMSKTYINGKKGYKLTENHLSIQNVNGYNIFHCDFKEVKDVDIYEFSLIAAMDGVSITISSY